MAFTAFYTGLSGLTVHQDRLNVVGNNIANSNTVGFKQSRALFETTFSALLSAGAGPSGQLNGVNPSQIGLGAGVSSTGTDFSRGPISITGRREDLAIEGSGFFILRDGLSQQVYSRDGSFTLSPQQILANSSGLAVLGYRADSNFVITPGGVLESIEIPLGSLTVARETSSVEMTGNLNAGGEVGAAGSNSTTQNFLDVLTGLAATSATLLTDLRDAAAPAVPIYVAGDIITFNAEKGGRTLQDQIFTVAAGSTWGGVLGTPDPTLEFSVFLEDVMGINTSVGVPGTPGVTIGGAGQLVVDGNYGTLNDIDSISITSSGAVLAPFTFTKNTDASGESALTPFIAYDSLGASTEVNLTFVMETISATGNTWRWYAESADDTDLDTVVGSGTLTFNTSGLLAAESGNTILIDRPTSAPVTIDPDFSGITQLVSTQSEVGVSFQDGLAQGTLNDFVIDDTGVVLGLFSNGFIGAIAQIALASFPNENGLISDGSNIFTEGPNSGNALVGIPSSFGSGTIKSGSLETSNVDIAEQFVDLVITSTGFTASSRVITTADELLQQLINIAR